MNPSLILWPILAQVTLTVLLYLRLAAVKAREIKAGNVDRKATALDQSKWPESVIKINNNLRNQFETPVLFCVLCILLWGLQAVDTAALVVAGLWLLFRGAHAFVHTTSNRVPIRMRLFIASVVMLVGLQGLAIRALLAAS